MRWKNFLRRKVFGNVLPKGHVEDGESLEQAARREIAEEAGFSELTLIAPLGVKERLDYSKRGWKRTHYSRRLSDRQQTSLSSQVVPARRST
jgi:8-oxo-dGTP pyrophosphatase MutT (NUDIX family)